MFSLFKKDICSHKSNNGDCDLVQQLKLKQAEARAIANEIKLYDNSDLSTVSNVIKFLTALEKQGLTMSVYYGIYAVHSQASWQFEHGHGMNMLERFVDNASMDDIDNIANELKALKQKSVILEEKTAALRTVNKDIADIKAKLGID